MKIAERWFETKRIDDRITLVHAGHDPSFDRARLHSLVEQYFGHA
jgi:hypothetical protein